MLSPPNSVIQQPKTWGDWFRDRVPISSDSYRDLQEAEHRWAFSIAGVTDLQFLADVNAEMERLLSDPRGSSFRSFAKNFSQFSDRAGWTGDNAWRRRLIWHMNTRNAYADGRWTQMTSPELLEYAGAWQWNHRWPRNPRRDHLALNRKLFPPGTQSFDGIPYPPSSMWLCHCVVTVVSKQEVLDRGLSPMAPVTDVPRYLPGRSPHDRDRILVQMLDRLPPRARQAFEQFVRDADDFVAAGLVRLPSPAIPQTADEVIALGRNELGDEYLRKIEAARKLGEEQYRDAQERIKQLKKEHYKLQHESIFATSKRKTRQIQQRLDEIQREIVKLEDYSPVTETAKEMAKVHEELLQKGMPRVEAEVLADSIDYSGIPEGIRDEVREATIEFMQLTSRDITGTMRRYVKTEPRAYASEWDELVNIGNWKGSTIENSGTLWHELGHHYEFSSSDAFALAKDWIQSRATGGLQPLSELTGNQTYGSNELAYPDKFYDPYVSKYYPGATEVLSMSLEAFNTPHRMAQLYTMDEDHFHLVMGMLKFLRR
ncbi:MAG: hypothetical protein J7642_21275 [Cyanobacteria bacterium SBC]|nr:hypothetical protein [Cyanobacteria bacterium SBC]